MSVVEIISESVKYPFSDITKFLIVGVIALLSGISSILDPLGVNNFAIQALFGIVSIIFSVILSGYSLSVINNGISNYDEIPMFDFVKNLVDGIKVVIIGVVYFLIPIIITLIFALITGAIGAGLDHMFAALGFTVIISILLFIIFSIFELVALARFAKTDDFREAFNFGAVMEDIKNIGFVNIIVFLILATIVIIVVGIIAVILAFIPIIGYVIAEFLLGGFFTLFYYRGVGLLYSRA